jgi:2-oxoisovalerate dehydrogenase E1 component
MTFRMRGHEEASGTKYVPKELFVEWEQKDPIKNFERYLISERVCTELQVADIRNEFKEKIEAELAIGLNPNPIVASVAAELSDVYAPRTTQPELVIDNAVGQTLNSNDTRELRFIDAISEALRQQLQRDPKFLLMGQDIAEYGGAFKITEGMVNEFGKSRIRNTPICESAIVGAALGLALEGYPCMVEMQFADFVSVGFNQIVNNLAKLHYRWGQSANVVVRMPTGAGVGAGPFHSQSNEAWFAHVPGLKVVYPSSPIDAKGLLIASLNDPNPVLFFEHKALYRSVTGLVPASYYEIEIGKARWVRNGNDLSIITYGAGVIWAEEFAAANPQIDIDILDLRTLLPLDYTAIEITVKKTGRALILHEDTLMGGIGGEIAAWIAEHCFQWLDAPVMRCASLDTPIPFNTTLEQQFLAKSRLQETVEKILRF